MSQKKIQKITAVVIGVFALCLIILTWGSNKPKKALPLASISSAITTTDQAKTDTSATETITEAAEDPITTPIATETTLKMTETDRVLIETSQGNIVVALDGKSAPISVKNFLEYVDSGFYADTIFHRVIKNFMIQGGGMDKNMKQKTTRAPIKNEADNGLKNDRGTIAMARTGVVDSATSQFFINTVNNDFLNHRAKNPSDYGYAVFGSVVSGMDIVDKIGNTETRTGDVPVETITITKISRITAGADAGGDTAAILNAAVDKDETKDGNATASDTTAAVNEKSTETPEAG